MDEFWLAIFSACLLFTSCCNSENLFYTFKTEPQSRAPMIEVLTNNATDKLAPGYIFLSANSERRAEGRGWGGYGPMIYTQTGELVWDGNYTTRERVIRMRVCDYLDSRGQHICYHDGPRSIPTFNRGFLRVFDNTYTQVDEDFGRAGKLDLPDGHEINTTPDGKALLQDVFHTRKVQLPTMSGVKNPWALDCCIQEVDFSTRELKFQWCLSENMPIADRGVKLPDKTYWRRQWYGGTGEAKHPLDLWHINSIDKDIHGDFIISVRHLNTVVKIAGQSSPSGKVEGSIIWRLGGDHNDFRKNFKFSRQHVAHFVESGQNKTTIVLLNNAFSGRAGTQTSEFSQGMWIELDTINWQANLLHTYAQPNFALTPSAGNIQKLPDNNVFIGWGHLPYFSEYLNDGTLIYNARMALSSGSSPQVWKFPWVGRPKTKPKLLPYMLDCVHDSPMLVYASWNGATEIKHWRIFTSNSSLTGPWTEAGTFDKDGFETAMQLSKGFARYVQAWALDENLQKLGISDAAETFIPNNVIAKSCHSTGCKSREGYDVSFSMGAETASNVSYAFDYDRSWSKANQCRVIQELEFDSLLAVMSVFAVVEWLIWAGQTILIGSDVQRVPSAGDYTRIG